MTGHTGFSVIPKLTLQWYLHAVCLCQGPKMIVIFFVEEQGSCCAVSQCIYELCKT